MTIDALRVCGIAQWSIRWGASPVCGSDPSECPLRRRHRSSDCTMSLAARQKTRRPAGMACFAEGAGPNEPAGRAPYNQIEDEQAVQRDNATLQIVSHGIICISNLLRSSTCRLASCVIAPSALS
jgi:hypothetical protein